MRDEAKPLICPPPPAAALRSPPGAPHGTAGADRPPRDFPRPRLRSVLLQVAAAFPVYRTYLGDHPPSDTDRGHVEWATAAARRRAVGYEVSGIEFLRGVLLHAADETDPALRRAKLRFVKRWQQFTAPVMAKAMEDTAFYRD